MTDPSTFTVGVAIRAIKAEPAWWLESAIRLAQAGYDGIWCWDHLMGRRDITDPVVEAWTILSMTAARTERVTVGPFVANVMNRHPGVLAKMASTLQIASGGRLVLGMGIGAVRWSTRRTASPIPRRPSAFATSPRPSRRSGAVDGRSGLPRFGILLRDAAAFPVADPAAAHRHRRRDTRGGATRGPDRRRLERVRRELRGESRCSTWTRSRPAGDAARSSSSWSASSVGTG